MVIVALTAASVVVVALTAAPVVVVALTAASVPAWCEQVGDFPSTYKTIRRAAIRLALTRELCRISDQVRLAKMLRSRAEDGAQVSVEQILSVSSRKAEEMGVDLRGTEVVPVEEVPVQMRRKASHAQVVSLEARVEKLSRQLDQAAEVMGSAFDRYRMALVNTAHERSRRAP